MPLPGASGCHFLLPKEIRAHFKNLKYLPRPEPDRSLGRDNHRRWLEEYEHWKDLPCARGLGYFCRPHGRWITCAEISLNKASPQSSEGPGSCPDSHYELEQLIAAHFEYQREALKELDDELEAQGNQPVERPRGTYSDEEEISQSMEKISVRTQPRHSWEPRPQYPLDIPIDDSAISGSYPPMGLPPLSSDSAMSGSYPPMGLPPLSSDSAADDGYTDLPYPDPKTNPEPSSSSTKGVSETKKGKQRQKNSEKEAPPRANPPPAGYDSPALEQYPMYSEGDSSGLDPYHPDYNPFQPEFDENYPFYDPIHTDSTGQAQASSRSEQDSRKASKSSKDKDKGRHGHGHGHGHGKKSR